MNAERLLALYERVAEAPDAITRLRRFILDLAVRGKLVPQDPNDEPASELLKRIAKEKARLVKAGEIPKFAEPKSIPENDLAFKIPPQWHPTSIHHILNEIQTGPFGSSLHQSDYKVGGTPVINPASIQGERIIPIAKMAVDGDTLVRLASFKLRCGDIVMARRGEMGRCAIVSDHEAGWLCGTGSLILRPSGLIFAKFLVLLIGSPFGRDFLGGNSVGTTMQNLNQSILLKLPFGLPPIAEQHRIVAKVDELMALCDQLEAARQEREARRDRLAAASLARLNTPDPETFQSDARFALNALPALTTRPNQIKQLRQTILNLAVRGKLVPQDPQDEPAPELLTRIIRHEETGSKKRLFNAEIVVSNQTSLHVLPPSWVWARLDVLAKKITDGEHLSPIKTNDGMKLLTAAHVTAKGLSLDNPQFVSIEDGNRFRNRCDPKRDDLLICSRGTIGRCAIIDTDEIFCLMGSVILLRPPSELSSRYLLAYLSTEATQKLMQGMSGATAVKALYLKDIRNCPVPIPPLAEQHRIVAKVDELMALCDRLEASLTTSDQTRTRLLEATLTEALAPASASEMEAVE
jgi:type I restriction enzyme S subunit